VKNQIIEVTSAATFQIGGCRVTIEPDVAEPTLTPDVTPPPPPTGIARPVKSSYTSNPAEWRLAEAELQRKAGTPFEIPTECKSERVEMAPRVGGKYHAPTGIDVEITKVIGRDGALWFVVDVNGRPAAVKRYGMKWHSLPRDPLSPVPGDLIIHHGAITMVTAVHGEAEAGGWGVTNNLGNALHVLHGEANHWMSLGAVQVEK
jgi:hypothetical protein